MNGYAKLLVGMLGISLVGPRSTAAQQRDSSRKSSTSLARVLAEVAQDIRTGLPTYLVATLQFPQYVVAHFDTRFKADSVATGLGPEYGAFGPYETAPDIAPEEQVTTDSVVVFSHTTRGSERVKVDPREVDALFLTPAAVDKFMIPFYSQLYGPMIAEQLRARILQMGKPVCHSYTHPCYVSLGLPRVPFGEGGSGHD